jgi:hypothetical protein
MRLSLGLSLAWLVVCVYLRTCEGLRLRANGLLARPLSLPSPYCTSSTSTTSSASALHLASLDTDSTDTSSPVGAMGASSSWGMGAGGMGGMGGNGMGGMGGMGGFGVSLRVRRLKDTALQKDILRDLTAGEFALSLEGNRQVRTEQIDFEGLVGRLDLALAALQRQPSLVECVASTEAEGVEGASGAGLPIPIPMAMGDLTGRIRRVRGELLQASENPYPPSSGSSSSSSISGSGSSGRFLDPTSPPPSTSTPQEEEWGEDGEGPRLNVRELTDSLRILVREDGTVDWDGALASGTKAAKFGAELWERLNGKEEAEGFSSLSELFAPVPAKVPSSPEIDRLANLSADAQGDVAAVGRARDVLQGQLRRDRREGRALGKESVRELKRLDLNLKERVKRGRLLQMDLDMEKICATVLRYTN